MKLVERINGTYLEDIVRNDIRFSNLAGRMTGSMYDNPDRPSHVLVLWIEDPDILAAMANAGVRIKERSAYDVLMAGNNEQRKQEVETTPALKKELMETMRHSIQFKAYPKMRTNRRTGAEEQYPKVMMKTTKNTVRLQAGAFGLVDSSHISEMSIRFHLWQWDPKRPDVVPTLDEIWVVLDEGAGEVDESYLDEKYGYEPEPSVADEEAIPFN